MCGEHQPQRAEKATALDKIHTSLLAWVLRLVSATQPRPVGAVKMPVSGLLHEAGFQADRNSIHLAENLVVAVHQNPASNLPACNHDPARFFSCGIRPS